MKNKYKAPPHWRVLVFFIIFTTIWNAPPVQASVSDNLNSIVVKILGQKNETTTKSNYSNATVTAKLNYLESKLSSMETQLSNIKTKVEVSGVPHIAEVGTIAAGSSKTFNGTGYLLVQSFNKVTIDGITSTATHTFRYSDMSYRIDFQQSLIIDTSHNSTNTGYPYALYLY